MGLETGTYISSLNSANPTTSDAKTEGDDHIRLLKTTILSTFPNITGAVTPTHTELNYVDGVTSAIQTQLDAKLGNANWSFSTNRLVNGGNTQPAFHGTASNSPTTQLTNFTTYTETYDQGSNFNNSTGVFVAPLAGVYLFVLDWTGAFAASGNFDAQIYNSTVATILASSMTIIGTGATGNIKYGTITALARLAASDNVVARTGNYFGGSHILNATSFAGVLLF